MQAVREVLAEIEAADTPMMFVFNKIDALGGNDGETPAEQLVRLQKKYPTSAFVSGLTGEGVDALVDRIGEEAARGNATMSLLVPYTRGEIVKLAHERTQVVTERHTADGTQLVLRVPADLIPAFQGFGLTAENGDDLGQPAGADQAGETSGGQTAAAADEP